MRRLRNASYLVAPTVDDVHHTGNFMLAAHCRLLFSVGTVARASRTPRLAAPLAFGLHHPRELVRCAVAAPPIPFHPIVRLHRAARKLAVPVHDIDHP